MFSSGVDLQELAGQVGDAGLATCAPFRKAWLDVANALEEMPKPVVCMIQGGCIGGALETALACDLRTMAADAITGLPETRIGLIPDVGGSSRLPQVVGLGRAKELIMTGKLIDGDRGRAHRPRQPRRAGRRARGGRPISSSTSCWSARPSPSGCPSASSTPRRARRCRPRSSWRSRCRRCARARRTSPRARRRSHSVNPSSGADRALVWVSASQAVAPDRTTPPPSAKAATRAQGRGEGRPAREEGDARRQVADLSAAPDRPRRRHRRGEARPRAPRPRRGARRRRQHR